MILSNCYHIRTDLSILQNRAEADMNCTVQNCLSSVGLFSRLSTAGCSSHNENCADAKVALMMPHVQDHAVPFHFATD